MVGFIKWADVRSSGLKAELHWAAGLLEGEGCFSLFNRTHKSGNVSPQFAIHCEMTDKDVIERLHGVFQVGTICVRENNNRKDGVKRKTSYIWSVQKQEHIRQVLSLILPIMGERRSSKIKQMLDLLNGGKIE